MAIATNIPVPLMIGFVVQGYILSSEYIKWWNHIISIMSCVLLFLFLLMWSEQDEFPVVTVFLRVLSWIRFLAHPHLRPCVFTEWVCVLNTLGSRLKLHLHYIYAFSRCFYPKRLTVHTFFFISMSVNAMACGKMWHNVWTSATGRTEACNTPSACRSACKCTSVVKCLPHVWARIV